MKRFLFLPLYFVCFLIRDTVGTGVCSAGNQELLLGPLTSFPDLSPCATSLTRLLIYNCQFATIPPEIGQLVNLKKLEISGQITNLPAEIGNLANLEYLSLSNSQLQTLPKEIGKLANLKELFLASNLFTSLPVEIGQLGSLQTLDVSNNQLTSLPDPIGDQLQYLTRLDMNNNNFLILPNAIRNLLNVVYLSVNGNHLTTLPNWIGELLNLRSLYLQRNGLTTVPIETWNLFQLQNLFLEDNQITALPGDIVRVTHTAVVYLDNNPITCLPLGLAHAVTSNTGEDFVKPVCPRLSGSTADPTSQPVASPTAQPTTASSAAVRVDGYVVERTRNTEHCDGPVRIVSGVAFGCQAYTLTHCNETATSVTVTKHVLDPLDPRAATCEAGAAELRVERAVHPRCAGLSGTAISCAGTGGVGEIPFPQNHAGMASLTFHDEASCQTHLVNPKTVLPVAFEQARNAACQWDQRFNVWYRETCDAVADTITTTIYADAACRKRVKPATVRGLQGHTPGIGKCLPVFDASHSVTGYRTQYCHN